MCNNRSDRTRTTAARRVWNPLQAQGIACVSLQVENTHIPANSPPGIQFPVSRIAVWNDLLYGARPLCTDFYDRWFFLYEALGLSLSVLLFLIVSCASIPDVQLKHDPIIRMPRVRRVLRTIIKGGMSVNVGRDPRREGFSRIRPSLSWVAFSKGLASWLPGASPQMRKWWEIGWRDRSSSLVCSSSPS